MALSTIGAGTARWRIPAVDLPTPSRSLVRWPSGRGPDDGTGSGVNEKQNITITDTVAGDKVVLTFGGELDS